MYETQVARAIFVAFLVLFHAHCLGMLFYAKGMLFLFAQGMLFYAQGLLFYAQGMFFLFAQGMLF